MNRKYLIFIASCIILSLVSANASIAKLTREQRISDANTLIALFEHRYAPAQWKKDYLGISLDDLTSQLISEVYREGMTDLEFYAAMAHFSSGVHDTHNWFVLPSTYRADLGFTCDYVDGKVLIANIDRDELPEEIFPFKRGDELVSMDGRNPLDIIDELSQYCSEGNELTQLRFLAIDLTHRPQRYYPFVPSGEVNLEIFSQERGSKESSTFTWKTSGRPITTTLGDPSTPVHNSIDAVIKTASTIAAERSPLDILRWSAIDGEKALEGRIRDPEPFFPMWDTFVKRTNTPLVSGIFLLGGYRIGFVRIPTWYPPDQGEWVKFFEEQIPYLEKETDALLIDQTDNGGGWICLGETVSEFLVGDPIPANLFQIRANRYFLQTMEEWFEELNQVHDNSLDRKIAENILDEIKKAIEEGRALTEPVSLCFSDGYIHSHVTKDGTKTVYTKPVLMLINEWSISTADMTPAPLQDAGRVVMLGSRTCGAGGNVETTSTIGYSDFQISQTESLTVRPKEIISPNGMATRYLENVGVIPDVEYDITVDDFVNGYSGYKSIIEETLLKMLEK